MRPAFTLALGLSVGLALPGLGRAEPMTTPVGAASIDITPSGPIRLTGYGSRKTESEGVEQRLKAKALAIGGDDAPAVLVTVDNCAVPSTVVEEVAARLKSRVGLARERFVVGSTHSHTAPALKGIIPYIFGTEIPADQQGRIDRYTEELTDSIEKVALAALADRKPARLSWTRGELGFAANRRVLKDGKWVNFGVTPDGPTDRTMPLLVATDDAGKPRALLVGYACHCTTLGGDFNKICGDWAGYACEAIERDHPGAVGMVIIGCGADANPEPRGQLSQARDHGQAVAAEVNRLLAGTRTALSPQIKARLKRIELPFDTLPTREQWTERAKKPGPEGLHARGMLAALDRDGSLPKTLAYPVQTWCFGDDLAMVFLAGEVVVDYDLRLKRECDPARLWVSAYCNDVPCYIASKRILEEGGYEADTSMLYYGRPTRFAPEVEDRLISAVHEILPDEFETKSK